MLSIWLPARRHLSQIVELSVDGPFTKGKYAQHDDIGNGYKHEQAQRTAIPCFGEDPPIDNDGKNDSYQADNDGNEDDGCQRSGVYGGRVAVRHIHLLPGINPRQLINTDSQFYPGFHSNPTIIL